jgi:hypothetical protein
MDGSGTRRARLWSKTQPPSDWEPFAPALCVALGNGSPQDSRHDVASDRRITIKGNVRAGLPHGKGDSLAKPFDLDRDLVCNPAVLAAPDVSLDLLLKLVYQGVRPFDLLFGGSVRGHAENGIRMRVQIPPDSPLSIPILELQPPVLIADPIHP